jgi:hypothetical protein
MRGVSAWWDAETSSARHEWSDAKCKCMLQMRGVNTWWDAETSSARHEWSDAKCKGMSYNDVSVSY